MSLPGNVYNCMVSRLCEILRAFVNYITWQILSCKTDIWKAFSSAWVLTLAVKLFAWLNYLLQLIHSSVWILICCWRSFFLSNLFSQLLQLYGLSTVWGIVWLYEIHCHWVLWYDFLLSSVNLQKSLKSFQVSADWFLLLIHAYSIGFAEHCLPPRWETLHRSE